MIGVRRRAVTLAATAGLVVGTAVVAVGTADAGAASPSGHAHPGYTVKGAVPASAGVSVEVSIPLRHQHALNDLLAAQVRPGSGHYHKWLTPQQFQRRYGLTDAQLRSLQKELAGKGVSVTRMGAQAVRVTGSSAKVAKLFATSFERVKSKGSAVRTAAKTAMKTPRALAAIGGRPIALSAAIRMHTNSAPANRYGEYGTLWFDDLKQAYKYPAYGDNPAAGKVAGKGQTVGLLMATSPSVDDYNAYFAHEHLTPPSLTIEDVNGGAPFDPNNGASFEANLDVQQAGGMAPNAAVRFYSVPDLSDASIFAGYAQIDEDNAVDEVSSSFGECELFYTAEYNQGQSYVGILKAYNDLFKQGNAQGITFVASSGDSGGLGCTNVGYLYGQTSGNTFVKGVETPAADPNVTGVGGTNLATTYVKNKLTSKYVSENAGADTEVPYDPYGVGANVSGGVWGSGGGFSTIFKEPSWQKKHSNNSSGFRAVPDVSLHMGGCPGGISAHCNPVDTADVEAFAGELVGVIGTSASSPDFAGTVALYNEAHGIQRSGNINPVIYKVAAAQRAGTLGYQAFHTKIPGDNGAYQTTWTSSGGRYSGYNEVLGNGTLVAKNFIFGRSGTPAAGDPQTPSNP